MKNLYKIGKRWRFRKRINGKEYSKYYDYKPTESEVFMDFQQYKQKEEVQVLSLEDACYKFLDVKDSELSPTTYLGYLKYVEILKKKHSDFIKKNIYEIKKFDMQELINNFSKNHKPKTTKNMFALIKCIIQLFREDFNPKITLPKNIKEEPYIPTDRDITLLLQHIKNTEFEVPIKLGLMGMRLSEVNGLTLDDIGDGEIKINKAKVRGYAGFVVKSTKTQASTRIIKVDKALTDKIKKQGFIFKRDPSTLEKYLVKFHKDHKLPHYSFHKLRHRFASYMISEGVPFQYVQKMGGWETESSVLKQVYTHALSDRDFSDVAIKGSTL